jgi:YVTN family beta-propeller protein
VRYVRKQYGWFFGGLICYLMVALLFVTMQGIKTPAQVVFTNPTYSSPIAMSADNKLVWSVNPDTDTVSVIRTDTNVKIRDITVGNEPQSVALDPNNTYAYVANAAGNNVTVIKITNANPAAFVAAVEKTVTTGAEPWNIVASPDGKRIFVANSAQDTITVIDATTRNVIGNVDLKNSLCNDPDRKRHFQPRGLAVSKDNTRLYVTRFLSFLRTGGLQARDGDRVGLVCRLNINTSSTNIISYAPAKAIALVRQDTGFNNPPPANTPTQAFPNQLQSVVLRGTNAYLPNIAASPAGPLKFNVDTQAFVNRIDATNATEVDGGAINMHLGARNPEPGKKKLFFANPWAIAFTNQSGAGQAYAVSAGSDLLVKLNVAANGVLSNTVDADTTRYIDLNDPANPATSGANAGKNPLGIVINDKAIGTAAAGTRAYVMNFVSRNVSVVNLPTSQVIKVIKTANLPTPNSQAERTHVGAEMFFSSRGNFFRPAGATVSTQERLSSEGWQNCASCHFQGWTDGVIWSFNTGPRKSVPLNGTFNPNNKAQQRILNYSAIFDEVQDFEGNIRNVSGPGPLNAQGKPPANCAFLPPPSPPNTVGTSNFDPNHGLLIGDNNNVNFAPCALPTLTGGANANRKQLLVEPPGSFANINALDALKEWVQFAVRTPNRPLTTAELTSGGGNPTGGANPADVTAGRTLFAQAKCNTCHRTGLWTASVKNFASPPAAAIVDNEVAPNTNGTQYLFGFLRNIQSFDLNTPTAGGRNIPGQPLVGGLEKDQAGLNPLGKDHDGDGRGDGFNTPSLLGIHHLPPYYHNGACETLDCVLADTVHRTSGGAAGDPLATAEAQRKVRVFLESIDAKTVPFF